MAEASEELTGQLMRVKKTAITHYEEKVKNTGTNDSLRSRNSTIKRKEQIKDHHERTTSRMNHIITNTTVQILHHTNN